MNKYFGGSLIHTLLSLKCTIGIDYLLDIYLMLVMDMPTFMTRARHPPL